MPALSRSPSTVAIRGRQTSSAERGSFSCRSYVCCNRSFAVAVLPARGATQLQGSVSNAKSGGRALQVAILFFDHNSLRQLASGALDFFEAHTRRYRHANDAFQTF